MARIDPQSSKALRAGALVRALQTRFAERLEGVSRHIGSDEPFARVEWLRDGGRHGGGDRLASGGNAIFDRASINVSAIHYDDEPDRRLSSATALSTIIHPRNPRDPGIHQDLRTPERGGDTDRGAQPRPRRTSVAGVSRGQTALPRRRIEDSPELDRGDLTWELGHGLAEPRQIRGSGARPDDESAEPKLQNPNHERTGIHRSVHARPRIAQESFGRHQGIQP